MLPVSIAGKLRPTNDTSERLILGVSNPTRPGTTLMDPSCSICWYVKINLASPISGLPSFLSHRSQLANHPACRVRVWTTAN